MTKTNSRAAERERERERARPRVLAQPKTAGSVKKSPLKLWLSKCSGRRARLTVLTFILGTILVVVGGWLWSPTPIQASVPEPPACNPYEPVYLSAAYNDDNTHQSTYI